MGPGASPAVLVGVVLPFLEKLVHVYRYLSSVVFLVFCDFQDENILLSNLHYEICHNNV